MKMKRHLIIYIATLVCGMMTMTSCSENDDSVEEFPNWQETNEQYFNSLYTTTLSNVSLGNSSWKVFDSWSLNDSVATEAADHIVVEVLNAGTGSGCPLYSDSVKVHYEGRLLPSTSYPSGYVFDKSFYDEYDTETSLPTKLAVSGVVDGFGTALQNMHIGDRWRVYIPYQLGYGTTATSQIPAYSTLIFDITLVAYYRAGVKIPTSRAAEQGVWIEE